MSSTQKPVAIVTSAGSGIGFGLTQLLPGHGHGVLSTPWTISTIRQNS